MTLKQRLAALVAKQKELTDLRARALASAQQADLELLRIDAQIALVQDLILPKASHG